MIIKLDFFKKALYTYLNSIYFKSNRGTLMKLSPLSIKILNNFATINNGLIIKPGNIQHSISSLSTIVVEAVFPDSFEKECAIYNIDELLKAVKTGFNDPEFTFEDQYVQISENDKKFKFYYADPSLIIVPKKKPYPHPDVSVKFQVTQNVLNTIKSMSGISLYFKDLNIYSQDDKIYLALTSREAKSRASNSFDILVGETTAQKLKTFSFFLQLDNLKILEGDYDFTISELEGQDQTIYVLRMTNNTIPVTYWTTLSV